MFNILVLNKNIDLKPLLFSIGSKFMEKEDDENDEEFLGDEFDNLTEEDYLEVRTNEFKEFSRIMNDKGVICYNISYHNENPILPTLSKSLNCSLIESTKSFIFIAFLHVSFKKN